MFDRRCQSRIRLISRRVISTRSCNRLISHYFLAHFQHPKQQKVLLHRNKNNFFVGGTFLREIIS